jgi:hypothetical protein
MNSNMLIEQRSTAKTRLRWFTLYADYPAAIRAKRLAENVSRAIGREWQLSAEMWKLDAIAPVGSIRNLIAQEAAEADVLLIAVSSLDQPDPAVIEWLHSLVDWKANRVIPGLLVGLLGDEDHKVSDQNWLVEELMQFAGRTQMRLAWHVCGQELVEDSHWLNADVEHLLVRKKTCGV